MENMTIPECLAADVLMRLPIKSILRFRLVCKSWYAILSNPEFSYADLFTVDPDDQILYKHNQNRKDEVFSLISLNNPDHISPPQKLPPLQQTAGSIGYTDVAGCCNGVVLLKDGLSMCLWNPATQETKEIKHPRCEYSNNVGFCYDAKTGDFKVVAIMSDGSHLKKDFVYSLRSDSWKRLKPQSPQAAYYSSSNRIAMNSSSGLCHWFGNYRVGKSYKEVILSFDANREMFKTTIIPYGRKGVHRSMDYRQGFFMLKDCVAMFCEREKGTRMYEIWAMLEVGVKESWIKVITIGPIGPFCKVLRLWTNSKVFLETSGLRVGVGSEEAVVIFDTFTGQTSPFLHNVNMPRFMLATNYKKSQVRLGELTRVRTSQRHNKRLKVSSTHVLH